MHKKSSLVYEVKKNKILFLMVTPAVIFFFVFYYLPMSGIVLAFKEYSNSLGLFKSPWVGLKNFEFFFISGRALLVTKNTILFNIAFIIVNTIIQVSAAIVLSELTFKLFKRVAQSVMFFPYFVSWVLVGVFVYNIFNYEYGVLNNILKSLNLNPINAYMSPSLWKYVLIFADVWKWMGYGIVVYLSAICGINPEYYESALIDGAGILKQIRHITLPLLKPTIIILTLLGLGQIMRGDFQMFYQIIGDNGSLFDATDIIDTFVFRSLMRNFDIGMASAAGLYQSVFCLVLIVTINAVVKRIEKDYALF